MDAARDDTPLIETLPETVVEALARTALVAFDVDGCLTDGRVVHGPEGETQSFDVHDGLGLKLLQREGITLCWITGRGSAATHKRAEELGITELFTQSGPKDVVLTHIQERLGISPEGTVSMGDDLPDLGLARRSAVFVAPHNARAEIRERAQLGTRAGGGRGAVRELCELILRAKGRWDEIVGAAAG